MPCHQLDEGRKDEVNPRTSILEDFLPRKIEQFAADSICDFQIQKDFQILDWS